MLPSATTSNRAKGLGPLFWMNGRLTCPDATFRQLSQYLPTPGRVRLSEDPSSRPLVLHALSPDWEDAQHPSGPGATTSCRRSRQDEETRSAFHVQLQRQGNGDWVVHPARLLVAAVLGDSASSGTLELLGRFGKLLLVAGEQEGALGGASQAITASAAAPQRRRRRQETSAAATAPRVHDLQQAQSAPRAGTAGPSARVPRTKPAAPPAGAATSPEAIPIDAAAAGKQPRQKQPEPDVGRGTFPADLLLGAANDATALVACAASCACAPLAAGAASGSDAPSSERALAARSPAAGEQEAQQPRRDSGDVGHVGQAQQPKAVSAARATTASTSSAPSSAAAASTAHHVAAASSGGSAPKSDGSGGGQQQAASAEDTCSTEIGIHAQPHTEDDEDDLLRLDGQCCRAYNKKRLCALYPKWARTPLPGGTRHAYKALLLRVITPPELGFGPELEQTFPAFLHKERRSTGFIHLYLDSLWVVARELDWQGGALFTLDRELHPTTATAAATAAAAAAAGGYGDTTKHPEELVVRVAAAGTGQMDEKTARMVDTRQRAEEERTRRRLAVPRDYVVLRLTSSMLRQRSESLEFTAPAAAASWLGRGARWDVAGDGALLPVRWTESDDTAGGESADLQRTSITLSARHQGVSQQCVLRALHPQLHKAQAVPGDVLVLSPLWRSVAAAALPATATDSIGPSRRCSSSGAVRSGGSSSGNADRAAGHGAVCGNGPATKAAAAVAGGGAATAGVPDGSGATAGPPAAAVHGQQQDQQSPAGLSNHPTVRYVSAVKAHLRRCSEWDAGGVVRAQHDGISSARRRRWLLSWTRTRTATAAACLAPAVTDAESAAGTSAGSAAASSGVTRTTGTPHTAAASSKSAGSPQRTTSASVQRRRLRRSSISVQQQPAPRAPQQPARPTASSPSKAPLHHHPVAAGTAVDPAAAAPPAEAPLSSNEATAEPVGPAAATPAAATPGKESGEVDNQHHAAAAEGSKQQQEQVTTEPRQPLRAVQPQQEVLQPPRAPVSPLASRALSQQLTLSPGRLTPLRLLSPPTSPGSATGVFRAAAAKSSYGSASGAAWRPSAVPRTLARFGAKPASGVPKTPLAAPSTPEPSLAAGAGAVPQPHQAVTTPHQNSAVICALAMTEASVAQAHFKFAAGNSMPVGASGGVSSSEAQAVEPVDEGCKGGSRSSADTPSQQPLPPVFGEPQQYQQQELRRRLLLARRSLHPLQQHAPDTAAVEGPSDAPLQSEAAGRIVSPPLPRPLPLMARRLLLKGWPPATSCVNAGPTAAAAGDSASQAADTFLVAAAQDLVLTTASQQQSSFAFIGDEPLLRCERPAEAQEDPCGLPRVAGSAAAGIDEAGHQLPSPNGVASIHLLHGAVRPRSIITEPGPMSPPVQKPAGLVLHSSDGVLQQGMAVNGSQLSTAARAEETGPPAAASPPDLPSLQQPEAAAGESHLNQNQTGEDAFTREPEELGQRVQQQRAGGTGDQQVEGQVAAAQQHIAPTERAPEKPCHTLYTLRLKLSQKARLGSAKAAAAERPLGSKRTAVDAGCEEEQPQQKRQRGPTRWDHPLQPLEQQQHQQQSNPLPLMTAVPEPVGSAVQRRPAPSAAVASSLLTAPQLQQVTPQPPQPAVRDVQREPFSPPPSPPPARRHQLSDGGLVECQPAAQHLAAASSWGTLLPLTPSRCDPHSACAAAEPLQAACEHSPAIPCKRLLRALLAELSSKGPEMRRLCSGPAGDVVTERLQWLGMAAVIAAKELSKRGALQPQQLCGGKAVEMRFQNCPLPELLVQVWLPQLGSPAAAADVDWTQASALAACGQIVGAIKKASQQGDSAALARWFQALVVGDFNKICLDLLEEESGRNDSTRGAARLVWASLLPEAMGPRYYCHVQILEAHS